NGIYYTGPQPPWSIMRSRWNDATSPAVVRSGIPVNISEVLWADDGDLAIAGFRDGPVVLIPADKSQPIQFIVADGTNLRWGP
ncbi:MAG TPA: hypothetical protein VMP08_23595, partial [Anaerolineae bacterium]|nr:hypothetical protein [Anaerolineae bacterium]